MSLMTSVLTPLADEASALVARLRRSVVLVHSRHGHGSGVIWDRDGLIVTNHHVAARGQAMVELADGRRLPATVVARDPGNDLALLRVPSEELRPVDLPAAPAGDSIALRVGDLVIAVGNPFGVRGTATLGIVSGLGGATWLGETRRELLQADIALAPGSSGGPLVNTAGEVVGIASMVLSPGIALAVPSHVVRRFVDDYRAEIAHRRAA